MAEQARLERDGDLGVLVIDHQPLNLFTGQMVGDILAALDEADGCRALLVRAEGKYFTGGVDVKVFKGLSEPDAAELTAELLRITHRIEELPIPTLASVHALCLTAGLELALACDMIWASESARFGLAPRGRTTRPSGSCARTSRGAYAARTRPAGRGDIPRRGPWQCEIQRSVGRLPPPIGGSVAPSVSASGRRS